MVVVVAGLVVATPDQVVVAADDDDDGVEAAAADVVGVPRNLNRSTMFLLPIGQPAAQPSDHQEIRIEAHLSKRLALCWTIAEQVPSYCRVE